MTRFDAEAARLRVRLQTMPQPSVRPEVAGLLALSRWRGPSSLFEQIRLAALANDGGAPAASPLTRAECEELTADLRWFLEHVGDGLAMTKAGYLRPVDVTAVANHLDLRDEWIGKMNREDQTLPVWEFREAMRSLGLVRVLKGQLLRTKAGERLTGDPVGLVRHLVAKLPLGRDEFVRGSGLLLMIDLAALPAWDPDTPDEAQRLRRLRRAGEVVDDAGLETIRANVRMRYLERDCRDWRMGVAAGSIGWSVADDTDLGWVVQQTGRPTQTVLTRCRVVPADRGAPWRPTPVGRRFLQAALGIVPVGG